MKLINGLTKQTPQCPRHNRCLADMNFALPTLAQNKPKMLLARLLTTTHYGYVCVAAFVCMHAWICMSSNSLLHFVYATLILCHALIHRMSPPPPLRHKQISGKNFNNEPAKATLRQRVRQVLHDTHTYIRLSWLSSFGTFTTRADCRWKLLTDSRNYSCFKN